MSTKKLQILGSFVEVDDTLTQAGKAADAKATGDAINKMQTNIDEAIGIIGDSSVADLIAGKADAEHSHDDRYYTEAEIDSAIANLNTAIGGKSDAGHTHDNLYYTETEIDDKLDIMQSNVDAKYTKPETGIPESDLSTDVQKSLGLANTALQEHQDISGKLDATAQAVDSAKLNGESAEYYLDYNNFTNTPTIPSIEGLATEAQIAELQSDIDAKVDKVEGKGLSTNDYTDAEKDKLETVEANANFYVHPTHTAHNLGLYKVTVDSSGHVSGATLAEKEDIVALGIPAQNTTYDTEISDLSDRIDDAENSINTTNQTLNGVSQDFENYKTTNNEAVSTNASDITSNKDAIKVIQDDYLTSTDKTQLQDDILKVSEKATTNESAIVTLNGEGEGSVKQSIDNAFNEFAANVTNDNVVNTYKELIDYAAKHGPEFTELVGKVDTIDTHVSEIETNLSSYKTEVSEQFSEVDTTVNNHVTDTDNPHGVTKEQIGLDRVDNTSDLEKPISDAMQLALDEKADLEHAHETGEVNGLQDLLDGLEANLDIHIGNTSNPHSVTKKQIGLGKVDNTSDLEKPISSAVQEALGTKADTGHLHEVGEVNGLQDLLDGLQVNIDNHNENKDNPHDVTAEQVGLGNVDNTSDLNKPISYATQAALDEKSDVGHVHKASDITSGTLSITRGGTGATNAETARTNLGVPSVSFVTESIDTAMVNVPRCKLLWENGSPTSSFANPSVYIETMEEYDEIIISTTGGSQWFAVYEGNIGSIVSTLCYNSNIRITERTVELHPPYIWFYECHYKNMGSSSSATTDNTRNVPLKIYGWKAGDTA